MVESFYSITTSDVPHSLAICCEHHLLLLQTEKGDYFEDYCYTMLMLSLLIGLTSTPLIPVGTL